MAYQAIGRGTSANDGTGDDLRTGAGKLNANFVEVYTYLGDGSTLSSDAVVTETATQTLTNKSLTSPTITGTGAIAGTFTGNITGNVTGNVTGAVTGNADTATALATARTIAGQSFDGTANITIAAADLSDVDQALATTDSPTFVAVTADLTGDVTGNVTGNIDGVVGGTTPAAGSFTTLSSSTHFQAAVYADTTARDAAITSPAAGMVAYLTATNKLQVYTGSAWETITSA